MTIELGMYVKDLITNFSGTVTGRCHYITGCDQALVSPLVKEDGTKSEGAWFDVDRLEILRPPTGGALTVLDRARTTVSPGPDMPAPIK